MVNDPVTESILGPSKNESTSEVVSLLYEFMLLFSWLSFPSIRLNFYFCTFEREREGSLALDLMSLTASLALSEIPA